MQWFKRRIGTCNAKPAYCIEHTHVSRKPARIGGFVM